MHSSGSLPTGEATARPDAVSNCFRLGLAPCQTSFRYVSERVQRLQQLRGTGMDHESATKDMFWAANETQSVVVKRYTMGAKRFLWRKAPGNRLLTLRARRHTCLALHSVQGDPKPVPKTPPVMRPPHPLTGRIFDHEKGCNVVKLGVVISGRCPKAQPSPMWRRAPQNFHEDPFHLTNVQ